jgi:uncharacterized membrane protein
MALTNTSSPTGSDTGLPSNVAAGLCAVLPLVGGIIFYFVEKKDLFVRHWAVQSIYFGGTWMGASLAWILSGILGHLPGIGFIFALVCFVLWIIIQFGAPILWIIGMIKAFQGEKWEYPIISEQGKKCFPNLS